MGRRIAATGFGGDSSPSSAESSFRELDDVFLQTQTRIWIEEVLDTRLDEDLHVSELLQDGELLFEVSKVVWNLLLVKCMELRYLKGKYGQFGSKKTSGRYKPYSNVDSFLKICKILGLAGIDLFSPSDVVEKRNTRKVCICIRALSRKARTKQLSVPDFDMVMDSVSMSTDMVGCIRRSLELSQPTFSGSSSYDSGSHLILKQKKFYTPSNTNEDSCSEESDNEAESRYMGENSCPVPRKFVNAGANLVLKFSDVEAPLGFDKSTCRQNNQGIDIKCQCKESSKDCLNESVCFSGSVKSSRPRNVGNDNQFDKVTSCRADSLEKGCHSCENDAVSISLENDNSAIGDSARVSGEEGGYIADYLAFSDLMVHAADDSNSVFLDGENNMFDFFLNADSQGLTSGKVKFLNGCGRKFSDDEDMEISSTTSLSSVLGRVLNLEFDEQFDGYENVFSFGSSDHGPDEQCNETPIQRNTEKSDTLEAPACINVFDEIEDQSKGSSSIESFTSSHGTCLLSETEFPEPESSSSGTGKENVIFTEYSDSVEAKTLIQKDEEREIVSASISDSNSDTRKYGDNHQISSDFVSNVSKILCPHKSKSVEGGEQHENTVVLDVICQVRVSGDTVNHIFSVQENSRRIISQNISSPRQEAFNIEDEDTSDAPANDYLGKKTHKVDNMTDKKSDERLNTSRRLHVEKFGRRPLLKTLFKGTAIAGIFLILLHINKDRRSIGQERMQYGRPPAKKLQTGIRTRYPVEQIKLGF